VISPLLFNLYLHYAFDQWMTRQFPHILFARYADDGLLHCNSEEEAFQLQCAIDQHLQTCGLALHPEKTKIVYCKDANRRDRYHCTQFIFLGYVFRARLAKSRIGKYFNSFSPAIITDSAKHIRRKMREWNLGRWTNAKLKDVARTVNSSL